MEEKTPALDGGLFSSPPTTFQLTAKDKAELGVRAFERRSFSSNVNSLA
jgi:hypothetical protein